MFLSRPNELLTDHISKVKYNYKEMMVNLKDTILQNDKNKETILQMIELSIELHDEGKKNPYFQSYIENMDFKKYKVKNKLNKVHSDISACYFLCECWDRFIGTISYKDEITNKRERLSRENEEQLILMDVAVSLAYNISKHHGNLGDLDKKVYMNKLLKFYQSNKEKFEFVKINEITLKKFLNKTYKDSGDFKHYMLMKLSYSLLVKSDYLAVYEFNNNKLDTMIIKDDVKERFMKNFRNNNTIKAIEEYRKSGEINSEINKYRSDIYIESEHSLLENLDKYIYFLEAPTGSGKSINSLNLGLKLLDDKNNKLIYVSPLNNISEQTYNTVKDMLKGSNKEVVLINSKECIALDNPDDEDNYDSYDKDYMNNIVMNYPCSLISSVKLFNILFGNKRSDNLMLQSIANSVIIIDEVQAYKNKIWLNIINSLYEFAKLLNIKFVIMSATLPKMNELLDDDSLCCSLITNRDYYYNFFKKRFKSDYSLLINGKTTQEELLDKIDEVIVNNDDECRILIQTLTVKRCETIYKELKKYEDEGFIVFKMLGITNIETRKYIIETIQDKLNNEYRNKKIILVGTQCIEAGIDIDMDFGFKDISILDSDEQFCGRIGRNFNKVGICYFYNLDDGNFIYKGDYRTEHNLATSLKWREVFDNKEFDVFYDRNFKWLLEREQDNYNTYKKQLSGLKYKQVSDTMKLIDNETYSFIFMGKYILGNGDIIDSMELLREYNQLKEDYNISYCEKQIKLKNTYIKLNKFIYNINAYQFKNDILLEKSNGLYIINDGGDYFDELDKGCICNKSSLNLLDFVTDCQMFI